MKKSEKTNIKEINNNIIKIPPYYDILLKSSCNTIYYKENLELLYFLNIILE